MTNREDKPIELFFIQYGVEGEGAHADEVSRKDFMWMAERYPARPITYGPETHALYLRQDLENKE